MKILSILAISLVISIAVPAQNSIKPIDSKSKVQFVIRNMGIATDGTLSGLTGSILINEKEIEKSSADVTVAVQTIDTDNERRDKHLRSNDFFDVDSFPVIRIQSNSIAKTDQPGTYLLKGTLTIKSVTKSIQFPFTVAKNGTEYLFSGTFKINRLDYSIGKSSATMSDEVKVSLQIYAE